MRYLLHQHWPSERQEHLLTILKRLPGPWPRFLVEPVPGKRNALVPGTQPLPSDHVILTLRNRI